MSTESTHPAEIRFIKSFKLQYTNQLEISLNMLKMLLSSLNPPMSWQLMILSLILFLLLT